MRRILFLLFLTKALSHYPLTTSAQELPKISDKVKGARPLPGFFPLYWDEGAGRLWMEVDKLDQEFLYVLSLPAGLGSNDIGLDRGLLGQDRVVKFQRAGRKLLLVQPNYGYRAITSDPSERRAVEQSFATSTLWGFPIEAEGGGRVLVDATDFFLRDAMKAAQRLRAGRQGTYTFDKGRSAFYLDRTRNFPMNTEVEASITLVNSDGETGPFVNSVTPSPEAITLRMHHSLVQLPDTAGFRPLPLDPRSGYFSISYFDYSTPVSEPIQKYFAVRHRLQKKDPSAAMSEPVRPIVYYLDNGTPEPIRSALLDGARWWNEAFEAAGYRNAYRVEVLPDTADPMDIRFNTINWVHRSTRGWSYGASVVDPRTGEIIKGQVSLGSLRVRQDYLIAQALLSPFGNGTPASDPMLAMALARLRQLSAHEVGHTLGLAHNYAASVSNRASVMDYPHPTVRLAANGSVDLSDAYDTGIGEWDKLAITWGYGQLPPAALDTLLRKGAREGLQYISDRDARAPGGAHPQAHLWDNGASAAAELRQVMAVRRAALKRFGQASIRTGTPLAFLEDALVPLYFYHRYQLEAAVKTIGGLQYSYSLRGDGQPGPRPVTRGEEEAALDALLAALKPSELLLPDSLFRLIPPRPSEYEFGRELFRKRTGLPLDALAPAESLTDFTLSFLFHPERLNRMVQQGRSGSNLSVNELVEKLVEATFKSARDKGMRALVQVQTEQVLLTYLLAASVDDNLSYATRSAIHEELGALKTWIAARAKTESGDPVYAGHLMLAAERMKAPDKAKPTVHKELPPGAPIGCSEESPY